MEESTKYHNVQPKEAIGLSVLNISHIIIHLFQTLEDQQREQLIKMLIANSSFFITVLFAYNLFLPQRNIKHVLVFFVHLVVTHWLYKDYSVEFWLLIVNLKFLIPIHSHIVIQNFKAEVIIELGNNVMLGYFYSANVLFQYNEYLIIANVMSIAIIIFFNTKEIQKLSRKMIGSHQLNKIKFNGIGILVLRDERIKYKNDKTMEIFKEKLCKKLKKT